MCPVWMWDPIRPSWPNLNKCYIKFRVMMLLIITVMSDNINRDCPALVAPVKGVDSRIPLKSVHERDSGVYLAVITGQGVQKVVYTQDSTVYAVLSAVGRITGIAPRSVPTGDA